MGISGFPYLVIPLNFTEPAYLENVYSILLFYLRIYKWNWPLWIFHRQSLKYLLHWSPGAIQLLSYLDQVKQIIFSHGYVPYQGPIDLSYCLYNPTHKGAYILSPGPSSFSDHFTTTMVFVDIAPSGAWLLIVASSVSEPSISVDSCF